jgi:ribosomal protein S8
MSRVGKSPINVPASVTIEINGRKVNVTGPRGTLSREVVPEVRLHLEEGRVLGGLGVAILSTPEGVMTGQLARQRSVGGEILCYVW